MDEYSTAVVASFPQGKRPIFLMGGGGVAGAGGIPNVTVNCFNTERQRKRQNEREEREKKRLSEREID